MKLSAVLFVALAAFASPSLASGQDRGKSKSQGKDDIPTNMRPPAGMCRVWLDDVPAAQQPAPTDCPTAVRNRPAKGRVIFGDDYVKAKATDTTSKTKTRAPVIKGFAPTSKKPSFP